MRRVSVLLAVTLLGCAPSTPEVPPVPTESATVTQVPQTMTAWPSPSESPTPTKTPEQQAAEAVVAEYFRLKNEIQTDPEADLEPLKKLLAGDFLDGQLEVIQADREERIVQQGKFRYTVLGSSLEDDNGVRVSACTDTTGTDLIDLDTNQSILEPDRNLIRQWTIEVKLLDSTWKATNFASEEAETCDA